MAHIKQVRFRPLVQSDGNGDAEWNNPQRASEQDGAVADISLGAGFVSSGLMASRFDFHIPGSATVTGVEADVFVGNFNQNPLDNGRHLLNVSNQVFRAGSTNYGAFITVGTPWPTQEFDTPFSNFAQGGDTDLAGLTTIHPEFVNSRGFGFVVAFNTISPGTTTVEVDAMTMAVWYQPGQGGTRSRRRDMWRWR